MGMPSSKGVETSLPQGGKGVEIDVWRGFVQVVLGAYPASSRQGEAGVPQRPGTYTSS